MQKADKMFTIVDNRLVCHKEVIPDYGYLRKNYHEDLTARSDKLGLCIINSWLLHPGKFIITDEGTYFKYWFNAYNQFTKISDQRFVEASREKSLSSEFFPQEFLTVDESGTAFSLSLSQACPYLEYSWSKIEFPARVAQVTNFCIVTVDGELYSRTNKGYISIDIFGIIVKKICGRSQCWKNSYNSSELSGLIVIDNNGNLSRYVNEIDPPVLLSEGVIDCIILFYLVIISYIWMIVQ